MPANSTEHHQPNQTRIGHNPNANENLDTHYLIAKRIDRIYSSILPWQPINLNIKTHTAIEVTKAETKYGSDHAPVATTISARKQIPKDQRPIPHWLAKHPTYATILQKLLHDADLDQHEDPFNNIESLKIAMRKASKTAMTEILNNYVDSPERRTPSCQSHRP